MSSPRFANDFTLVGQVTVTPESGIINVGEFSLGAAEDTLWVEVRTVSLPGPWSFSYGILGFQTSIGNELGRQKVWPSATPGTYRLTNYLAPSVQTGQITFEPRSYNLAWVRAGTPWTVEFYAKSGQSVSGVPDGPAFGTSATLGVLADLADKAVKYAINEGFARIRLLPRE